MGTYYPELEDINQYETEDNRLNDYGQHNEAHIDNMIQRYKRLTLGSFDADNVRRYQERLEYWQNRKYELAKPENVDNDGESGIISFDIDELVPCLRDNITGEIVDTDVEEIIDFRKLKNCTENNGWDFPWNNPPKGSKVFALHVKGSNDIEGLIAIKNKPDTSATYMCWGNAAPHNRVTSSNPQKKYNGVGGHLFAIAAQESLDSGFGGFIYADAANEKLFEMFINKFGAIPLSTREYPYRFMLEGDSVICILDKYNFDWR